MGSTVSYGSAEGLGPQLEEADGRGYGFRVEVGLGLGVWLGCHEPVGLGLGLVDGLGANELPEGTGTGEPVGPSVETGVGETVGVELVNGIGVSDGSGTLANAGVTAMPNVAAAISDKTTALNFN
ncbi:unannotated protein [freshwater metagenome]|uniref:Unannotated protein n=1 Tax=freshwater metagenome TaxID=449393 RepID=A0A6J6BYX3_9ZZZZ|nr:hypothetical protein [Actinomycetota bacterium]